MRKKQKDWSMDMAYERIIMLMSLLELNSMTILNEATLCATCKVDMNLEIY